MGAGWGREEAAERVLESMVEVEQSKALATQLESKVEVTVPSTHDLIEAVPWKVMRRSGADLRVCLLEADAMRATDVVMVPDGLWWGAWGRAMAMVDEVASDEDLGEARERRSALWRLLGLGGRSKASDLTHMGMGHVRIGVVNESDLLHLRALRDIESLLLAQCEDLWLVARAEQLPVLLETLAEELLQQLISGHGVRVWDARELLLARDVEAPP